MVHVRKFLHGVLREAGFGEAVFHIALLQSADHFVEVALDHVVEVVKGKADAVVGDAVLREVLGADFFLASGTSNQAPPVGGILGFFLVAFVLEETGAEDFQSGSFVFLL